MSTFEKIRKAALARLDAGEPAHIILQDYADFEEELRPVLENATGKSVSGFSATKPKVKSEPRKQTSALPVILGGLIVLVLALSAAIFVAVPGVSQQTIEFETNCVGIPQPAITSKYALLNQNQQDNNNTIPASGVVYESDGEGAVVASGRGGGGGGGADSVTTSDSVSISADESETTLAMATSAPTMTVGMSDDAVDMEYAEEEIPADYDSADSRALPETGGGATYAPDASVASTRANISTEPMRAGEIDDNAEWDDYQEYRNDFLENYGTREVRNVDTTGRQVIRVVDNDGNPILNACVEIFNGDTHITSSLTYATGMTMFFPNLNDSTRYIDTFRVVVSKGNTSTEATLDRDVVGGVTTVSLAINQNYDRVQLDVMFLLDATGSMGDEISQLQGNILTISEEIDALPDNVDVRYGLVTYLDRGDIYVTRVHDFTASVEQFQNDLIAVEATGGGDYPESMNEGLDMALNAVEWRGGDTVRLMFLVADAPPHVDYDNDADYSLLMQDALARGIKIHQIASGGLEPEGEFVMRQIGQFTMGHFLFLTYEDGVVGTPGDERPDLEVGDPEDEQGIGDYSVSQLDELVLRLITDEIEALRGQ